MPNIWKPTRAECAAIRNAAAREALPRIAPATVVLEPGYRWSKAHEDRGSNINVALVSDTGLDDTDLADYGNWSEFTRGVPLTEGGRAIVDFYIRRRGDQYRELLGNVTVTYEGGRITRIRGYGSAAGNDYPLPDLARALAAAVANECCYRSDGWEEHLADRFERMLREAGVSTATAHKIEGE